MKNDYGIYLAARPDGAAVTIRFPVNPKEINIEYPGANERFNVLALGEIVQPRKPGLRKFSWDDGLLPGDPDAPWVLTSGGFQGPEFYISFLNRCKVQGAVAKLTIDRRGESGAYYGPETVSVVVEDFSIKEKGGETGDVYYSVVFTEYRDYKPGAITLIPDAKMAGAAVAVEEPRREVPAGQLTVGSKVTVNGTFCNDSYGGKPHGNGNGWAAVVGRIITTDAARPYPVLVKTEAGGLLGWCAREALT